MKPGMRVLGVDDGPFNRNSRGRVLVVGAVFRGDLFDGLLSTRISRDGWNATERLEKMIMNSKFHQQLHAVMLDGIALGGFNVVDIARLHETTRLPVIAVSRKKPDMNSIRRAVNGLARPEYRLSLIECAGPIYKAGKVNFQVSGASHEWASALIEKSATRSYLPEPLRAAHLIAGGLVRGQSGRSA